MPWAIRETIAATGSPGISRGNVKFRIKANNNVTKNHTALFPKYFKYAFNPTPPLHSQKIFYYKKNRVVEMFLHLHHPVNFSIVKKQRWLID
jgi:hypothetical protein